MTYLMLGDLVWAPQLFFFSASFLVAPRHRTMLLPRHPPRSCATCVLATETLSLGFPTIFGQIFTCTSQEYWRSSMAAVIIAVVIVTAAVIARRVHECACFDEEPRGPHVPMLAGQVTQGPSKRHPPQWKKA